MAEVNWWYWKNFVVIWCPYFYARKERALDFFFFSIFNDEILLKQLKYTGPNQFVAYSSGQEKSLMYPVNDLFLVFLIKKKSWYVRGFK